MASKQIAITVETIPLKGKSKTIKESVPVTVTGTTVGAIAERLGIDLSKRNITVDGSPASPTTIVGDDAKIQVTKIRVGERAQGS
jgi:hypothetical protein